VQTVQTIGGKMRLLLHRVLFGVLLIINFVALTGTAYAAKGVVVYKKGLCDYFIVETNLGYALLEWYGGYDPDEGDIIVGDFESYGFKEVYDLTTDTETHVWVEDYWLTRSSAIEQYFDKCH
jgi:hypothetical protein